MKLKMQNEDMYEEIAIHEPGLGKSGLEEERRQCDCGSAFGGV